MDGGGERVLPDGEAEFRGQKAEFGEFGGRSWRFWTKHGDEVMMGGELNGGGRGWLSTSGGERVMAVLVRCGHIEMPIVMGLSISHHRASFSVDRDEQSPCKVKR